MTKDVVYAVPDKCPADSYCLQIPFKISKEAELAPTGLKWLEFNPGLISGTLCLKPDVVTLVFHKKKRRKLPVDV